MLKRLLRAPSAFARGKYGALLARLSPRQHQSYVRSRIRGPYKGRLADELAAIMDDLSRTQDQGAATRAASEAIRNALERGEFDRWVNSHSDKAKTTLIECADFLPGRSWKLQIFYIDEGHSHAPHSHTDVASCLVVGRGTIHAREYDRFHDRESDPEHAALALASDRRLGRGEALLTTRSSNDVHWFGAVDGPAAAFNFQAVGFVRGRKALEARRLYVDPTAIPSTGVHQAPKLNRKQAQAKFEARPLSDFPLKS